MRRLLVLLSALAVTAAFSAQAFAGHRGHKHDIDHSKHRHCVWHHGVWLCGKKNKPYDHCKKHGVHWHCTRHDKD